MSDRKFSVIIIGGGYSGTLTAVNIFRENDGKNKNLLLIERNPPCGRGLAYRSADDNLVLNVPAGNMSALATDPDHFVVFCQSIDPAFNRGSFISRRIYGDYLEDTLAEAERLAAGALRRVFGEAVAVSQLPVGSGFRVVLADGRDFLADQVILALGHFPPLDPLSGCGLPENTAYLQNPWNFQMLDGISRESEVLVLGAGHTAVDTVFRLTSSGSMIKIYLLSRRGLLPHSHRFTPRPPAPADFPAYLEHLPATAFAYLHGIRGEIKRREAECDWRDIMNELRPFTAELWQRLPVGERRRFLNRILPYWDIHRHRLAPAAYRRIQKLLACGQVELLAGRAFAFQAEGGRVKVKLRLRADSSVRDVTVGAIVNCTGPNYDLDKINRPLIIQLLTDGLIARDLLGIGLEVDDCYRLIGRDGLAVPGLYYIGPMLKAKFWEAIAIPELRNHALSLSKRILVDA